MSLASTLLSSFPRGFPTSPLKLLCESDGWSDCESRPDEVATCSENETSSSDQEAAVVADITEREVSLVHEDIVSKEVTSSLLEDGVAEQERPLVNEDAISEKNNSLENEAGVFEQEASSVDEAGNFEQSTDDVLEKFLESSSQLHSTTSSSSNGSKSVFDISYALRTSSRAESPTLLLASPISSDNAEVEDVSKLKDVFRATPSTSNLHAPISNSHFELQHSFLSFMEPGPSKTPSYDTLPPGGCPRFHVYDKDFLQEELPGYKPSAYKIGVCARKLEWYTPHEISPIRSWKNFIVELNSTQINFYLIPSQIEPTILNSRFEQSFPMQRGSVPEYLKSFCTTDSDIEFYGLCEQHNIINSGSSPSSSRNLSMTLLSRLGGAISKRLVRSYSLQHAKIGLASDYTKRSNVLRLRLENEQLLMLFRSPKEMIEWNLGISVGRDLALDLSDREMPRYRTVPRRRRNQIDSTTPFFNDVITRRSRAQSDPNPALSLRGRLFKLKGKLIPSTPNNPREAISENVAPPIVNRSARLNSTGIFNRSTSDVPGVSSQEVVSAVTQPVSITNTESQPEDDLEEDVQNMSDLHESDDEDDLDNYIDIFTESPNRKTLVENRQMLSYATMDDYKWFPVKRVDSERRTLRDSIKCIRPLVFDDSWLNKTLVKPTTMSPLTLAFMRETYIMSSNTESVRIRSRSSSNTSLFSITDKHKRRNLSGKDSFLNLPDAALLKIPHHNLREYSVGLHSLTPKYI